MSSHAFDLLAQPIQHVLWDMRWEQLRPIQVEAIQTLLTTSQDALISARTASGKTEAAFLPILSRLFEQPGSSVGAVYIGPLKALINDQFRRLEDLCERAEIPVHRWHGDVDQGKKNKLLDHPAGVLLITPESLESFFINRASTLPRVFRDLRFVAIDEIHALLGRERGLQLRSQLFRLQRYCSQTFRLVGLSATIGDSVNDYQAWMRPKNPESVRHIHDPGEQKRVLLSIQAYAMAAQTRQEDGTAQEEVVPEGMVDDILKTFAGKKNLIFANRRTDVEWLADSLNESCRRQGRPQEFLVHHGSLSKETRAHAETEMRARRPTTAVCSSTLELGIDIGNVTTVGQLGPCWSVNSQVQRLGRSGRQDHEAHCMRTFLSLETHSAKSDLTKQLYPELLQAIATTELLRQRWVEPPNEAQWDLSTLVQQILSSLAEHGGLTAQVLYARLVAEGAFTNIRRGTFAEILRSLGKQELIEQENEGLLLLAPKGERLVHDRDFYSAFATPQELAVRFEGRLIGTLSAMYLPLPGDNFLLGGRRWQVLEVDAQRGEVSVAPAKARKRPIFAGGTGRVHRRVREMMRDVLCGDGNYPYLNEAASELLGAARAAGRQARLGEQDLVSLGNNCCLWFTWTGTVTHNTLALIGQYAGLEVVDEMGIALRFNSPCEQVAERFLALAGSISEEQLVALLEFPEIRKFDEYLTQELLRESFAADQLDLPAARQKIEELSGEHFAGSTRQELFEGDPRRVNLELTESGNLDPVSLPTSARLETNGATPLSDCEFVAFDIETTGLSPIAHNIVELAAVRFRMDGTEVSRFETLINPECPIPLSAAQVHQIDDAMVQGKPTIQEVLPRFIDFLGNGDAVLLAHNAGFDIAFLAVALARTQLSPPSHIIFDTLAIARSRLPQANDYRLSTIAALLHLPHSSGHRALGDSLTVKNIFCELMRQAPMLTTVSHLAQKCPSLDLRRHTAVQMPAAFDGLTRAIEDCRPVAFTYGTKSTLHQVSPCAVIAVNGHQYLLGLCRSDWKSKSYRLDRITTIRVAEEHLNY